MIFGEMRRKSGRSYSDQLQAMSEDGRVTELIPADARACWRNEQVTLIQHTLWNTLESEADHNPVEHNRLVITAWARIDNRAELAGKLDLNASDPQISDSDFILSAYQKWGEDCVDHLIGDFVFVIFDVRRQKIFCARDHMGVRPFYYHLCDKQFIFASSLSVFTQLKGFELKPSKQWMADYLLILSISLNTTAYANIIKLPPAHCLTISADKTHLRQYFELSAETTLHLNDTREYVDAYRELLEESIRCRLRSEHPVGTELSGGLDSSTITAYAARLLPQPQSRLHAFAFTFEQEAEYVHAICDAYPMAATHAFTHPSRSAERRQQLSMLGIKTLGYPSEYEVATSHEPFYRMAEGFGIRTMLSGYGGDEFVTCQADIARIELLTQGEYRKLYRNTRGNPVARLLRILKLALHWQRTKNHQYNPVLYQSCTEEWAHQTIKDEWAKQFDVHQRFFKQQATYDAGYNNLNAFTLEKISPPYTSVRMETCTLMAATRKIEYRWPLLDMRLVKLFLSIPASEKHAGGIGRLLHRRAIDGIVPKKVAWREYKDLNMPSHGSGCMPPSGIAIEKLHPDLTTLLDLEKLGKQQLLLSGQENIFYNAQLSMANTNIDLIISLNQWLHHIQPSSLRTAE